MKDGRKQKRKKWAVILTIVCLFGIGIGSCAVWAINSGSLRETADAGDGILANPLSEGISALTNVLFRAQGSAATAMSASDGEGNGGGSVPASDLRAGGGGTEEYAYLYVQESSFSERLWEQTDYSGVKNGYFYPIGQIAIPSGLLSGEEEKRSEDKIKLENWFLNNIDLIDTDTGVFFNDVDNERNYTLNAPNMIKDRLQNGKVTVLAVSRATSEEFISYRTKYEEQLSNDPNAYPPMSWHIDLEFQVHDVTYTTNQQIAGGDSFTQKVLHGEKPRELTFAELNQLFYGNGEAGKSLVGSYYSDSACSQSYDFDNASISDNGTTIYVNAKQVTYVYLYNAVESYLGSRFIKDNLEMEKSAPKMYWTYLVGQITSEPGEITEGMITADFNSFIEGIDMEETVFTDGIPGSAGNKAKIKNVFDEGQLIVKSIASERENPGFKGIGGYTGGERITLGINAHTLTYYKYNESNIEWEAVGTRKVIHGDKAVKGRIVDLNEKTEQIEEYYADRGCTTEFNFTQTVTGDMDIYVTVGENLTVYVYVMDYGWEGNSAIENWIGVTHKDDNDYYPFGKAELSKDDINMLLSSEALRKKEDGTLYINEWGTFKDYIKGKITTSEAIFNDEFLPRPQSGLEKAGKNVAEAVLNYADSTEILNQGGQKKTALFYWYPEDESYGFLSNAPATYHLDLLLYLHKLNFVGVVADKDGGISNDPTKIDLGETNYLENQTIIEIPYSDSEKSLILIRKIR